MSDTFKPNDFGYEGITLELHLGDRAGREKLSISTFVDSESIDNPGYQLQFHLEKLFHQAEGALMTKGYIK